MCCQEKFVEVLENFEPVIIFREILTITVRISNRTSSSTGMKCFNQEDVLHAKKRQVKTAIKSRRVKFKT
jgi:hypothetical protein